MGKEDNLKPFTSDYQPQNRRSRKGVPNRSTTLNKWLAVKREINAERNPKGEHITGTVEDEIVLALIDKACKGDVPAIREVLDTKYGKQRETIEHIESNLKSS